MYDGDLSQAIALWEQVIGQASPESKPRWVLRLARAYIATKQFDLAVAQLSWVVAVSDDPKLLAPALGLMGSVHEIRGEWEAAIAAYREHLALSRDAETHVLWRMANAYGTKGDTSQQIQTLESIDTTRLEPAFRAQVLAELASAYRRNLDPNSALAVYEEILSFAQIASYRALIMHYQGETLREAQHDSRAIDTFVRVVTEQPDSFAAFLSLQELAKLPEPTPAPTQPVTPTQGVTGTVEARAAITDLTRGIVFFYAQQYPQALEYLNYHIQAEPALGIADARYYLGLTLTKQGQFEDAIEQFDEAIELAGTQELLANAWLAKAWAIGASGSDPSAFYHEFYVNHSAHERAPEALWEAARASERGRNWTQAALYYETLATKFPQHDRAQEAAFRQGLAAYAQGDAHTASTAWRAALYQTEDPVLQARLITWMGLAAQKVGVMDQADIHWREAARIAPDSYYGLRAQDLLKHTPPRLASGFPVALDPSLPTTQAEWQALHDWVATWFAAPPTLHPVNDPRVAEVRALEQLGWHTEATASLRSLQQAIRDNPHDLVILARITKELHVYPSMIWSAQRAARLAREAGIADPPDALMRLVYPVLWERLIAENSVRYDLDPLLLLALVRQESLFSPWARSSAGALGLAQVMPPTGLWIAERLQMEGYNHDLLLRPHISLHFGAWFLDLLLGLYDRDWIATLVAYNAGPGNLRNWTNGQPIADHDLFYETLPFQEPRDYVTAIYENLRNYERLYRPPSP